MNQRLAVQALLETGAPDFPNSREFGKTGARALEWEFGKASFSQQWVPHKLPEPRGRFWHLVVVRVSG